MSMGRRVPKIIELKAEKFKVLRQRSKAKDFRDEDYEYTDILFDTFAHVLEELKGNRRSIDRLKKLLFGASTEKTEAVIGEATDESPPSQDEPSEPISDGTDSAKKRPAKGHGRNGADAYHGAEQVEVPHECLKAGDPCPDCKEGSTLYELGPPSVVVRIVGQPPLGATVYKLQKFRCNLCGKTFTAKLPEGAGSEKYDATAAAMIGLLKYGSGLPFNRMEGLQRGLGIPLPASTQWDIVYATSNEFVPIYRELFRQAAQGDVIYNDDTLVKILELMGKRAKQQALADDFVDAPTNKDGSPRTGMFTSGVVSTREGRRIALFFSGRQHAGENLKDVLSQRAAELGPPIQMCDGLSRNLPGELKTILANCLSHGRRQFVDVVNIFPEECRYVLEALSVVYKNDATARKRVLPPAERLRFHQAESVPIMDELHAWMTRQFDERLAEPNSVLGQAIRYMLKHWKPLTLFLRKAGAPLDNNICERALKKAILHRKNSLFYRSQKGARVGDLYMSLIYTCEFCGANPFDYFTELQRHAGELSANPESWMPWNYRSTVKAAQIAA
jgi:hypothetical protein